MEELEYLEGFNIGDKLYLVYYYSEESLWAVYDEEGNIVGDYLIVRPDKEWIESNI